MRPWSASEYPADEATAASKPAEDAMRLDEPESPEFFGALIRERERHGPHVDRIYVERDSRTLRCRVGDQELNDGSPDEDEIVEDRLEYLRSRFQLLHAHEAPSRSSASGTPSSRTKRSAASRSTRAPPPSRSASTSASRWASCSERRAAATTP